MIGGRERAHITQACVHTRAERELEIYKSDSCAPNSSVLSDLRAVAHRVAKKLEACGGQNGDGRKVTKRNRLGPDMTFQTTGTTIPMKSTV